MKDQAKVKATGAGLLALLLWSTTVGLARSLTEKIGAVPGAAAVFTLAGLLGLLIVWQRGELKKMLRMRIALPVIWCGGLFLLYQFCLYVGLGIAITRVQVLEVSLLNYLWTVLTLVLAVPILHFRASGWLAVGVALGLGGIILVTLGDSITGVTGLSRVGLPHLFGLAAGISWALYSNLTRKWQYELPNEWVYLYLLVTGAALLVVWFTMGVGDVFVMHAIPEILLLAFSSIVAYVLWGKSMQQGNLVMVGTAAYLTPLLSTFFSSLYLSITPSWVVWAGCGLTITGAVLCGSAVHERTV